MKSSHNIEPSLSQLNTNPPQHSALCLISREQQQLHGFVSPLFLSQSLSSVQMMTNCSQQQFNWSVIMGHIYEHDLICKERCLSVGINSLSDFCVFITSKAKWLCPQNDLIPTGEVLYANYCIWKFSCSYSSASPCCCRWWSYNLNMRRSPAGVGSTFFV